MCFFFQISRVTPRWAGPWGCSQTSLTTTLSYHEGHYDMFEILRPNRTYYFDNIVTPSARMSVTCETDKTFFCNKSEKNAKKVFLFFQRSKKPLTPYSSQLK